MAVTRQDPTGLIATRAPRVVQVAAIFSGGTGGASLISWQNPESSPVLISYLVHVKTAGSAGDAVTIGCVTDATASGTNMANSLGITVAGTIINGMALGTGFRMLAEKDGTNDYITGQVISAGTGPSGTAVADIYLVYWPTVYS